jgi:hypothetical protein
MLAYSLLPHNHQRPQPLTVAQAKSSRTCVAPSHPHMHAPPPSDPPHRNTPTHHKITTRCLIPPASSPPRKEQRFANHLPILLQLHTMCIHAYLMPKPSPPSASPHARPCASSTVETAHSNTTASTTRPPSTSTSSPPLTHPSTMGAMHIGLRLGYMGVRDFPLPPHLLCRLPLPTYPTPTRPCHKHTHIFSQHRLVCLSCISPRSAQLSHTYTLPDHHLAPWCTALARSSCQCREDARLFPNVGPQKDYI